MSILKSGFLYDDWLCQLLAVIPTYISYGGNVGNGVNAYQMWSHKKHCIGVNCCILRRNVVHEVA